MIVQDSEVPLVPLPSLNLQGEDLLEAYTARSMLVADSERAVAWTRSALLGGKLLEFAIVCHWFTNEPSLSAEQLKVNCFTISLPSGFHDLFSQGLKAFCRTTYCNGVLESITLLPTLAIQLGKGSVPRVFAVRTSNFDFLLS